MQCCIIYFYKCITCTCWYSPRLANSSWSSIAWQYHLLANTFFSLLQSNMSIRFLAKTLADDWFYNVRLPR